MLSYKGKGDPHEPHGTPTDCNDSTPFLPERKVTQASTGKKLPPGEKVVDNLDIVWYNSWKVGMMCFVNWEESVGKRSKAWEEN